ncbi:hypothetical protein [Streptomyces sp. bgisy027]|uniref:hypothetical protein n=1 Tax=Streptomyces sp. bgisy027 TaxID=3413770 RepID=UPI003D732968
MNGRTLYAPTLGILVFGIVLGLVGIFQDGGDVSRAGILIAFAALPPLCYWQTQRAHQDIDDRIADAHASGYQLALKHVARGLLDQNAAPPDGGEKVDQADADRAERRPHRAADGTPYPVLDNVRPLRPTHPEQHERKIV